MKGFLTSLIFLHPSFNDRKRRESGQTLVEFVFLMAIVFFLTFALLRGFNVAISTIWQAYISIIAEPTPSPIEFN